MKKKEIKTNSVLACFSTFKTKYMLLLFTKSKKKTFLWKNFFGFRGISDIAANRLPICQSWHTSSIEYPEISKIRLQI